MQVIIDEVLNRIYLAETGESLVFFLRFNFEREDSYAHSLWALGKYKHLIIRISISCTYTRIQRKILFIFLSWTINTLCA